MRRNLLTRTLTQRTHRRTRIHRHRKRVRRRRIILSHIFRIIPNGNVQVLTRRLRHINAYLLQQSFTKGALLQRVLYARTRNRALTRNAKLRRINGTSLITTKQTLGRALH